MDELKRRTASSEQRLSLENRTRLSISGVEEVESFDENTIALQTEQGYLIIRGSGLHIEKLNLEGGELLVEGMVDALTYEEAPTQRGSFFSRLFHA